MNQAAYIAAASIAPVISPTKPRWDPSFEPLREPTEFPEKCDICVVGAGMSGISAAHYLTLQNRNVVLVEARDVCSGATSRNGGFLHATTRVEMMNNALSDPLNAPEAYRKYRFEQACKSQIRRMIADKEIECEHRKDLSTLNIFEDEEERIAKLGFMRFFPFLFRLFGSKILSASKTRQLLNLPDDAPVAGAVLVKKCTDTFNSHRFYYSLLSESVERGLRLYTKTRVEKVIRSKPFNDKLYIHTDRGVMQCNEIIYATNAWTEGILTESFQGNITPARNHVCALRKTNDSAKSLDYAFSYRDDFIYCLPLGEEIILGGFRDVKVDKEEGIYDDASFDSEVQSKLDEFIEKWFPGYEKSYEWTGIIANSENPWIGDLPFSDHEYICAGFGGHGLPRCFLAGQMVARMCLKEPMPWALKQVWPQSFRPKSRKIWWKDCCVERIQRTKSWIRSPKPKV